MVKPKTRSNAIAGLSCQNARVQSDSYPITEEHIKYQDQKKKAANTAAHSRSTVVKPAATPEKKQNDQHDKDCAHASSFSLSSSQFPACLFQTIRNTANMAGCNGLSPMASSCLEHSASLAKTPARRPSQRDCGSIAPPLRV